MSLIFPLNPRTDRLRVNNPTSSGMGLSRDVSRLKARGLTAISTRGGDEIRPFMGGASQLEELVPGGVSTE